MEVNCDLKQCLTLTQKPTEVRKGLCIHVCIVAMMEVFHCGGSLDSRDCRKIQYPSESVAKTIRNFQKQMKVS